MMFWIVPSFATTALAAGDRQDIKCRITDGNQGRISQPQLPYVALTQDVRRGRKNLFAVIEDLGLNIRWNDGSLANLIASDLFSQPANPP